MHFGLCLSEDAHKSSAGDDSLMRFLIITSSRYDIKSASSPAWPIIFFSSSSHAHSKSGLVFVTFVTVKIVTILPVIDNSCGHSKIHHKNLNRQNHYYRHLVRIQFFRLKNFRDTVNMNIIDLKSVLKMASNDHRWPQSTVHHRPLPTKWSLNI